MALTPEYDHEHPCPTSECADHLRAGGVPIPEDVECCLCYFESEVPE